MKVRRTRPAHLTVYQSPRNPTPHERRILTLLAEGRTHKQAAAHRGIKSHSLTAAIEKMRQRYTAPTNVALIALAVRLQWIALAIDCADPDEVIPALDSPQPFA